MKFHPYNVIMLEGSTRDGLLEDVTLETWKLPKWALPRSLLDALDNLCILGTTLVGILTRFAMMGTCYFWLILQMFSYRNY